MESRPLSTRAREQLLHIEEAKCQQLRPAVKPVSLERKFVSMLNPSNTNPDRTSQTAATQQPSSTHTTAAATTAAASSTTTPTTSVTTASTATAAATTTAHTLTTTSSITTITASASSSSLSVSSSSTCATTATPRVATTAPAAAAVSVPAPAAIVGGKRPLGEESPVIVFTQAQDGGDFVKDRSGVPGPDLSPSGNRKQLKQKQTRLQKQKPGKTTSKLSTGESTTERGREPEKKGTKSGVQFSDTSPKRDVGDVMQFFQEQEKSLQESFLSLPKRSHKKQRSPSPKVHPAAGLEQLDNLIRLMEQLTTLKDENSRLRKRCDYLESTKILLQAKRELSGEGSSSSSGFMTLPTKHKHRHHHHQQLQDQRGSKPSGADSSLLTASGGRASRPRISSAEEMEYLEIVDSSSDQRPKRPKSSMHKRSFSTGSLEVPSELLDEVASVETRKRIKSKTGRSIFSKSSGGKQKSKGSKWARVKKVLTGQKLYEDLGTTIRSIRELGKSSQGRYSTSSTSGGVRYSTSGSSSAVRYSTTSTSSGGVRHSTSGVYISPHDLSPPSSRVSSGEHKPVDSLTSSAHEGHSLRPPMVVTPGDHATTEHARHTDQDSGDPSLSSEIWMGPPDWWEEFEANKEGGTSTTSEVSSVIEVTTMYLGSKKDTTTTTIVSTAASPGTTATTTTASSLTSSTTTQEKYLKVDVPLPRRQSSPSLSLKEELMEEVDLPDESEIRSEISKPLHKSSSCASADLDLPKTSEFSPSVNEGRQTKKPHRTAWGRVKDIIHTRRDSIKKRPKREKTGLDSEETSEIDIETFIEDQWKPESFAEGLLSRSTPKSSPMIVRQLSASKGDSPPRTAAGAAAPSLKSSRTSYPSGSSPGNVDMAALLAGSMSNEFTKKMQEWEMKRSRKSPMFRASIDESDIGSLDVSSASHEFPIRTLDLRDLRGKIPDSASEGLTPEESNTSMEVLGAPSINVEEIQKRITDSFSRKMQEWERLKYKGSPVSVRDLSPDMERKGSKGRKDDRTKSKRSREEKEKEKLERQRERDMQKVEREQLKLEKEKLRIEKERLRALEREAKLEKLKGRLSQSEVETGYKNPILSPLAEYKVTADFARKLHEWELRKGLSHDVSNSIYLEAQKMSMQHLRREGRLSSLSSHPQTRHSVDSGGAEGGEKSPPSPLALQPYWDSPEDTSPVEKFAGISLVEGEVEEEVEGEGEAEEEEEGTCTSVTEECLTKSNIATLERANTQLLETLQAKEMEYAEVQDEVQKVNDRLAKVKEEHAAEMARFHRELAMGTVAGPVKLEVSELEATMGELEEKIKLMENFGEKLAMSMESSAVGMWQSIEGEETVHTELVELVDKMRGMLVQASQSAEKSQKTMALSNFETLYSQAMKLQVQMNNLRLSHLERNREIMVIKRQLLLQEVNNLLLQADITRREAELYQFQEAKRFSSLKRWNTFSGADRQRPQVQIEIPSSKSLMQRDGRSKQAEPPHVNIPYIAEDVILASAASSSLSAPASPSAIAAAGGAPPAMPLSAAGQSHSSPGAAREQSTDHVEKHLLTPSMARRDRQVSPVPRRPQKQDRIKDTSEAGTKPTSIQESPKSTVQLRQKNVPSEQTLSPATAEGKTSTASGDVTKMKDEAGKSQSQRQADAATGAAGRSSSREDDGSPRRSPSKPEITTVCDSGPLSREIEELKRVKRKVAKGSTTLMRPEGEGLSPAPSPGADSRQSRTTESPDQFIPGQSSLDKPRLIKAAAIIDDDYSPAMSVMECTEPPRVLEQTQLTTDSELGAVGGLSLQPLIADTYRRDLPPTCDQSKAASRSPRSPVSKHKLIRRQREERDTKLKDYSAISPKGSPVATRGKPPLPRQTTPVKQSPSASPATDKGSRSKSVGDMDRGPPDSPTPKPLQDAIDKFEKRATVCETEDRPVELRKTPSPTLHLPRVGLVSRVRRLKPAAELLEESQRYRSGHSIYATRIMQRFLPKDERKPEATKTSNNKENVSGTYVHAMVQRLSRETTPIRSAGSSRTNSDLSLQRTDSPRAQSEFVTHIVKKLSSPSGPEAHKSPAPFKDLTNEGQVKKLTQSFNGHTSNGSPDRTLSETNIDKPVSGPTATSTLKSQHRKSCEVAMVLSSSEQQPMSESSYRMVASMSSDGDVSQKPDSTTGPTNHQSLPILVTPGSSGQSLGIEETSRDRAATYCAAETDKPKSPGRDRESESPQASPASQPPRPQLLVDISKKSKHKEKSGKPSRDKRGDPGKLQPPLSPERKGAGRGKMETIGVLCKQSISFDLGVSLYAQQPQAEEPIPKSRQAKSWDPSESAKAEAAAAAAAADTPSTSTRVSSPPVLGATGETRPISSGSEGEMAPSSPTSEEKKKSKRFFDSSWLQKSKKFFKVSK